MPETVEISDKFRFSHALGGEWSFFKKGSQIKLDATEFNELVVFFAEHFGMKEYEEYLLPIGPRP